jgi:endogenous inhibitor of DNA gyrase (YacG/DUF329 family)
MYRQFSKNLESKIKVCLTCGKEFIPLHHGGTKEYCSQRCSCISNLKLRKEIPKKTIIKKCNQCGNNYEKNPKASISQWNMNKFCSHKCSGENKKIKDGLTKNERHRRKTGATKMHSPEWLEKIKATTKEGMLKPEVKEKITKPRAPMSEEGKIIRSDALVGMLPKNLTFGNGSFSNVQRGEYECSKGSVYFRSKWEANYALYLDFLIKNNEILNWEYEADVFFFEKIKLGTRSYRPDFKIFNSDGSIEYHEVKGYMDSRSKTKLKRMGIYYATVKYRLLQQTKH